jgi:hypothetical protein
LSTLTKVAIVFHVIVSLLLAAGLIVFVNRTENFKNDLAAAKSEASRAKAELMIVKDDDAAQQSYAAEARRDRDAAAVDNQKTVATLQSEISTLKSTVADDQTNAKLAGVASDNMTAALNASEASRTAQAAILESTRKDNNDLATKYSQSQLAIADLTSKLEVAQRTLTNSLESVAELTAAKEEDEKRLKDANVGMGGTAGLQGGAPPIDGIVRSTRPINGIPYATISVGADAQVKPGMKFQVIDRDKGDFLGELTIEQVDEKESTGKLEGPRIGDVHAGTEVKTQL